MKLTPQRALEHLRQIDSLLEKLALSRKDHQIIEGMVKELSQYFEEMALPATPLSSKMDGVKSEGTDKR